MNHTVISTGLQNEPSDFVQLLTSLQSLESVFNSVFTTVNNRIGQSKEKVHSLSVRVGNAQAKVQQLPHMKEKAITIVSPAIFPSHGTPNIDHVPASKVLFQDTFASKPTLGKVTPQKSSVYYKPFAPAIVDYQPLLEFSYRMEEAEKKAISPSPVSCNLFVTWRLSL